MIFSIGDPTQFSFSIEVDEDGKLTEITATDGEAIYDCQIQLTSRDNPAIIWCCTSELCTGGPCEPPDQI